MNSNSRGPTRPALSIVTPVYLCSEMVAELVRQIQVAAEKISEDYEIILVEDGSPDDSWNAIEAECKADPRVKGVKLSRNFGQHFAMTAGLAHSNGDAIVMLDCDLQDDPKYIPALYAKLQEGYGIVLARREQRNYGFMKNIFSILFYRLISWISDFKLDPNTGNYTILSRRAVDAFLSFNDYRRGYLFVLHWIGFSQGFVTVAHRERDQGRSSYSIRRLISMGLDMALSYSDKPLRISIYSGLLFSFLSFAGIAVHLWQYFFRNIVPGWTSLFVMIGLVGGLLMIFLGVIGLYISKMFEQTKNRPLYIVQDTVNLS